MQQQIKIPHAALYKDVKNYPDAFQYERAQRLGFIQQAIQSALKRLNLSRKNTLQHPKADLQLRANFQRQILAYEAEGRSIAYLRPLHN